MSLSLGEKLRQAREGRGISISEVSEQTRISSQYLECIENDDYKPLPGGIFNKGFVKSYARFIGFDEQEAMSDYAKLVASNAVAEQGESSYRPEVLTDDQPSGSMVPTIIFAGIILALMTGGILFLVNYLQEQSNQTRAANRATNVNKQIETPAPTASGLPTAADPIRLEFKTLGERVSVKSTIDGKVASEEVQPDSVRTYVANESLKLSYYRGFADRLQLTLNGKPIASPRPPVRGNSIEFEINRENLARIWSSGEIAPPEASPEPTLPPQPQTVATPTPEAAETATPVSTPLPLPSPRITPRRPVNAIASPTPTPSASPTRTTAPPANATRPRQTPSPARTPQ